MALRWDSNNQLVVDRQFTIARVVNGEIQLMPDPKSGAFVGVHLDSAPVKVNQPPVGGDVTTVFEV